MGQSKPISQTNTAPPAPKPVVKQGPPARPQPVFTDYASI